MKYSALEVIYITGTKSMYENIKQQYASIMLMFIYNLVLMSVQDLIGLYHWFL